MTCCKRDRPIRGSCEVERPSQRTTQEMQTERRSTRGAAVALCRTALPCREASASALQDPLRGRPGPGLSTSLNTKLYCSSALFVCLATATALLTAAPCQARESKPLAVLQAAASPTGNAAFTLLFPGDSGGAAVVRIAVRTATTPAPETITQPDSNAFNPDWLDSKTLLFLSDRSGVPQLYSSRLGTQGDPVSLSNSQRGVVAFLPAPSGRLVALLEEAETELPGPKQSPHWYLLGPATSLASRAVSVVNFGPSGSAKGKSRPVATLAGEWPNTTSPLGRRRPPLAWTLFHKREILLGIHMDDPSTTTVKCLYPPSIAAKTAPLKLDLVATAIEGHGSKLLVSGFSPEGTRRVAVIQWMPGWRLQEGRLEDAMVDEQSLPKEPEAHPLLLTGKETLWHLAGSLRLVRGESSTMIATQQQPFRIWDAWPSPSGLGATATLFLADGSSAAIQIGAARPNKPATLLRLPGIGTSTLVLPGTGGSVPADLVVGHHCSSSPAVLLLLQSLSGAAKVSVAPCGYQGFTEMISSKGAQVSGLVWLGPATQRRLDQLLVGPAANPPPLTWIRWVTGAVAPPPTLHCPQDARCLVGPSGPLGIPDPPLIQRLSDMLASP